MKSLHTLILSFILLLGCAEAQSAKAEQANSPQDATRTAITVYNGNFGVVRDLVPLGLSQGITEQSSEYEKTDAQTIEFPVKVAPGATQTVRYVVEYNW